LSVDPLRNKFPYYTPYQYAANKPIACVDLEGLEDTHFTMYLDKVFSNPQTTTKWHTDMAPLRPFAIAVTAGLAVVTTGGIIIAVAPEIAAGGATVGWWAANPANQELIVGLGGVVASFFDPNPASDYPGIGDNFAKGFRAVFKFGKQESTFIAEVGSDFANASEKGVVSKLLGEGNNVTLLTEANKKGIQGVETADVLVNGVLTEIKEISGKQVSSKLGDRIKEVVESAIGQGGANNVIIDISKQEGVTLDLIKETANRVLGKNKDAVIRFIGKDFDQTFKATEK